MNASRVDHDQRGLTFRTQWESSEEEVTHDRIVGLRFVRAPALVIEST